VFYPFSLLVGDYICTQSGSAKATITYRILLIASAIPFLFLSQYFLALVVFRVIVCVLFSLILIYLTKKFILLEIKSTYRWIAVTYVFYSGTLLLVPLSGELNSDHVKFWFIGLQVGLGLILKQLDFSIRAIKDKNNRLLVLLDFAVFGIPFILLYFYPDFLLFSAYIVSAVALKQLRPRNKIEFLG
jgi:hypothetical protein